MNLLRLSITAASNMVTSATNFVVSVALISSGGPNALAAFTLIAGPWILGTTLVRSVATQVLLADRRRFRDIVPLITVAALLGSAIALGVREASPVTSVASPVLIGIPFALLQDPLRYLAFSRNLSFVALVSDSTWLVVVVAGFLLSGGSATRVCWSWSLGAIAGCVVMAAHRRVFTRFGPSEGASQYRYGSRTLIAEAIGTLLCGQVLLYGLPLVTSTSTLGLFRFTQTLLVPAAAASGSALAVALAAGHMDQRRAWRVSVTPACVVAITLAGLAAFAPLVHSHLNYPVTPSTLAALILGGGALVLATRNQAVLTRVRGSKRPASWLPRRFLASGSEPILGLPAAAILGVPGAMLGLLVMQVALLSLFSRDYIRVVACDQETGGHRG